LFCILPINASIFDIDLRNLAEPERHLLSRYRGVPLLIMFFEPDCSWCYRQVKVLNTLSKTCDSDFSMVAVGVNGSRAELLKTYQKSKPKFPAYQISQQLQKVIGKIKATPFMLLVDGQGLPLSWFIGYLPKDKLVDNLQQYTLLDCTGVDAF